MKLKSFVFSFIFFTILLLNSCTAPVAKQCLSPQIIDLKIKWGDYIMKKDILVEGYILHSNGNLFKLKNIQDTTGAKIGNLNDDDYCEIQKKIRNEFLKIDILNVTADTMRFVEYKSEKSLTTQRAFWNSNFKTETNEAFFDIFDKLTELKKILE